MNANTKKWGIIGIIAAVALVAIFLMTRPSHLSGRYVANTGSALVFKGDKFEDFENGEVAHKGTYEIKDDELKLRFSDGNGTTTAKLAKDNQSFDLESTGNTIVDLFAKNIKYIKK